MTPHDNPPKYHKNQCEGSMRSIIYITFLSIVSSIFNYDNQNSCVKSSTPSTHRPTDCNDSVNYCMMVSILSMRVDQLSYHEIHHCHSIRFYAHSGGAQPHYMRHYNPTSQAQSQKNQNRACTVDIIHGGPLYVKGGMYPPYTYPPTLKNYPHHSASKITQHIDIILFIDKS
jgi:hypothetical protein